jgi:D-threo-aldose 1-dehydrogenase
LKYRKLGQTGLEISEVIFGGGAVGGILINADDDTRRTAIREALNGGINWIDSAASYGNGKSESALGWLLNKLPEQEKPYVSTKTAVDRNAGDYAGQVEAAITASLGRMQMDSVDLYQLHNRLAVDATNVPNSLTPDDVLKPGGVADAFQSLVDKGLTRHIGFTCTGEAEAMHKVMASGRFETAQVYYNLLNPSAGRDMPSNWNAYDQQNIIGAAEQHGVGVMVIRVFAAGIIATDTRTGKEGGVVLRGDVASDEARMRAVVPLLTPDLGARAQVAIRYALRNSGVSGVVVGLAELEHLRLSLEAAEMGPLPASVLEKLDKLADSNFGT